MKEIEFWKMNGSGNDFIIIDNRKGIVPENEMVDFVRLVCRRRESVGADGLIFITKSEKYEFGWRFFNADGSEVEMCGNGSRCVARYAYLNGIAREKMTFETLAGPVSAQVDSRMVRVKMPDPSEPLMDLDIQKKQGWLSVDFINTGVPHVVVQVQGLDQHPVFEYGKMLRYHRRFETEGTNADFIEVIGPNNIRMRTYERGVENETLACGTGAIASALIGAKRDMVSSPVKVITKGGDELIIHFKEKGDGFTDVWLEGSTSIVYKGRLHSEATL